MDPDGNFDTGADSYQLEFQALYTQLDLYKVAECDEEASTQVLESQPALECEKGQLKNRPQSSMLMNDNERLSHEILDQG